MKDHVTASGNIDKKTMFKSLTWSHATVLHGFISKSCLGISNLEFGAAPKAGGVGTLVEVVVYIPL